MLINQMYRLIEAHTADLNQLATDNQAISRILLDTLEQLLKWDVPKSTDLSEGQAIVAFAFGQGTNSTPGGTNHALAAVIKTTTAVHPVPVFAQWEIADALAELGVSVAETAVSHQNYLSTEGVWQQFLATFLQSYPHIQKIILIAHPDHQYRCHSLIVQSNIEVLTPAIIGSPPNGWAAFGCDTYGYDLNSVQPWTRNRADFIQYELSIRIKHLPLIKKAITLIT